MMAPAEYTVELRDVSTGARMGSFPHVIGRVLPGPIGLAPTLTPVGIENLERLLADGVQLPDELLVRAESGAALHRNLDHAVLDVALALEVFIDQLLDQLLDHLPTDSPLVSAVSAERGKGIYSAYDSCLKKLGKVSLRDADAWRKDIGENTAFEILERIFAIRNNLAHRGVREFTLERLNTKKYVSEYLDRHRTLVGIPVDEPFVRALISTARTIIRWMRENNSP